MSDIGFRVAVMGEITDEWRVIDNWWNPGEEKVKLYRVVTLDSGYSEPEDGCAPSLTQVSDDGGRSWRTFEYG